MTITDRSILRKEFMKANPTKEVLDGRKTYFTIDYVEHLENLVKNNVDLACVSKTECYKCKAPKINNGWLLCDKCQND